MKAIKKYDQDFLRCRTIGHSWDVVDEKAYLKNKSTVLVSDIKCKRCDGERQDIHVGGYLDRRTYNYSEGYLVKGLTTEERFLGMRKEVARRVLGKADK